MRYKPVKAMRFVQMLSRLRQLLFPKPYLQIVCGCDHVRFSSLGNHEQYAARHGLPYIFDMKQRSNLASPYYYKLGVLLDTIQAADWTFWIDDDAYFMQMNKPLREVLNECNPKPETELIFCKSPINEGRWTYFSAGNFFARNTPQVRNLFAQAMRTDLNMVREWWDEAKYGLFTNGDQDALVYLIETNPALKRATMILNYEAFNCREFHFAKPNDHFLVHFSGMHDKQAAIDEFAQKHGLGGELLT